MAEPRQAMQFKPYVLSNFDQYKQMYERSVSDPNNFWADIAADFYWEKKVRKLGILLQKDFFKTLQTHLLSLLNVH